MKDGNTPGGERMEKKNAPPFCLLNQNDESVCLKDFRGKWVVLYFYPKDNSKSCTLEALSFTDNIKSFKDLGAVVIGVSPDSVKSHKNFAHKHNLDLILLSDPEQSFKSIQCLENEKNVW